MQQLLLVFLGGGLGASTRFGIGYLVRQFSLPWWSATFGANMLGVVLLFSLAAKVNFKEIVILQHLLVIGYLGALTTFSTLIFEIVLFVKQGKTVEAISLLLLHVFFGIIIGIGILR